MKRKDSVSLKHDLVNKFVHFSLCYTSPVWLITEIDGVRIISGRTLDFFQRLPNEVFNVLDLLSTTPGAKLYSAYMDYKV